MSSKQTNKTTRVDSAHLSRYLVSLPLQLSYLMLLGRIINQYQINNPLLSPIPKCATEQAASVGASHCHPYLPREVWLWGLVAAHLRSQPLPTAISAWWLLFLRCFKTTKVSFMLLHTVYFKLDYVSLQTWWQFFKSFYCDRKEQPKSLSGMDYCVNWRMLIKVY